jgi:DNA-binding beta-propeller fold protein YncE
LILFEHLSITAITTKRNTFKIVGKKYLVVDSASNYLTGWGSYGKGPEQLNQPEDIATDNKGLIYVTDTRNSRIQILEIKNDYLQEVPVDRK